ASQFWAVLIGIDAYLSSPLCGCVPDTLMMKELLMKRFGVPEHHIQCLLGSKNPIPGSMTPSRANITNLLYGLTDNNEIQGGDNIIIHYAGHGSSYHCLQQCTDKCICHKAGVCPVEVMCPIDHDNKDPSDSRR
ncbi:hypothetical protein F5146DRAFT_929455, partial [Armillaria mellea]